MAIQAEQQGAAAAAAALPATRPLQGINGADRCGAISHVSVHLPAYAPPYPRTQLSAAAVEAGAGGLSRVLSSMGGTAMLCVLRASAPIHGSAHAAFYGSSWDGQRIACVVTGVVEAAAPQGSAASGGAAVAQPARLQFHFRSESAEVISHVQVPGYY